MAIIDVVKYQGNDEEFISKYPKSDIRLGSQLIVNVSQVAFFVKGGQIHDHFEPGTYTLTTENIPILNRLINLPFGSQSPFQAEVYFVNLISKLDLKWGTTNPIQLEDPKYNIIVPIRAFGQYGIKIKDPRLFFESLVGNMESFSIERINEYFKGKLLSSLTTIVSKKLITDQISILEINSYLDELSIFAQEKIKETFLQFGIDIVNFYFISINIPENDPSVLKLKESKDLAAKLKILGKDLYQMDRSFNVLDKAADNEGGIAGSLAGVGIGLGVGSSIGSQMASLSGNLNTNIPPEIPTNKIYHLVIDSKQNGPFDLNEIKQLLFNKTIDKNTLVWKPGMTNWESLSNLSEVSNLLNLIPPPPPNIL